MRRKCQATCKATVPCSLAPCSDKVKQCRSWRRYCGGSWRRWLYKNCPQQCGKERCEAKQNRAAEEQAINYPITLLETLV